MNRKLFVLFGFMLIMPASAVPTALIDESLKTVMILSGPISPIN